jgi:hypothetical protein
MTPAEVLDTIADIHYERAWWEIVPHVGREWWLQVRFRDEYGVEHHGRKWRLSEHMTRSEVVRTALAAVLAVEEHEARERFLYRGQAVYGPHFDVNVLADLVGCNRLAVETRPRLGGDTA